MPIDPINCGVFAVTVTVVTVGRITTQGGIITKAPVGDNKYENFGSR